MTDSKTVNPYGDKLQSSVEGFGSDVSSQRVEPFEEEMLARAAELKQRSKKPPIALDLFSGYCAANGLRLAKLGFTTYAFDLGQPDNSLLPLLGHSLPGGGALHYRQGDVRRLKLPARKLTLVTAQRSLHFLHYRESRALMVKLAKKLKVGGLMFFSIGAVDCKVGDGYKHADLPVADRWHPLEAELGGPIHVTEPLCLYKQEDVDALFADLGGRLVKLDRDDFGLFIVEFRKD